jgi:hypothetical protein
MSGSGTSISGISGTGFCSGLSHRIIEGYPMKIRTISLHEPYASLIRAGRKKFETRSWYTRYRGPLLIHAAKRNPDSLLIYEFAALVGKDICLNHCGNAIAIVDLIDCIPTVFFTLR